MATSRPRRTTRHSNPLAPGTAYSDYCEARERFFETLRRESALYRLEAAWKLPPVEGDGAGGAERSRRG